MYKETRLANNRYNSMMWTPAGAKWTFVFISGKGEVGTQPSDLQELDNNGPFAHIKKGTGWQPDFNVIAIQPPNTSITWQFVQDCLADLVSRGMGNFVLSGLSGGAEHIYLYMRAAASKKYDIKATIPMSFGSGIFALEGNWRTGTDKLGEIKNSAGVVLYSDWYMADTPSWGLCGTADNGHYDYMKLYYKRLMAHNPETKFTSYNGGHGGWNTLYAPNYGLYEWAEMHALKGASEPDPIPEPTTPEPYKLDNGATLIFNQDGTVIWK